MGWGAVMRGAPLVAHFYLAGEGLAQGLSCLLHETLGGVLAPHARIQSPFQGSSSAWISEEKQGGEN